MSWESKENHVFWLTIYADKKGLSCLPSVACLVPVRIIGGQLSIKFLVNSFMLPLQHFFGFYPNVYVWQFKYDL